MNILFAEDRAYYDLLGLEPIEGVSYTFGGVALYKASSERLSLFDMFVCAFYFMPNTVILTLKFKKLGVRTVLVADGIFDICNAFKNKLHRNAKLIQFHTVLQDYFLCVGSEDVNYFRSCNFRVSQYMPKRVGASEKIIPLPRSCSVLITTANTAYFDENEYKSLLLLLVDACKLLGSRNVSFCVRLFDSRLYSELCLRLGTKVYNDTEDDFENTLGRYSCVISTPSSVVITSMLHRRPTAILVYRDYPILTQAGWLFASAHSFEVALDGFLGHDTDRMFVQERLRVKYLSANKLADVLSETLTDGNFSSTKIEFYINRSLYNMLNSHFNYNIAWVVRRIYLRLSKFHLFKNFVRWMKDKL